MATGAVDHLTLAHPRNVSGRLTTGGTRMKFVTLCLRPCRCGLRRCRTGRTDRPKLLWHIDQCWASAGNSGTNHQTGWLHAVARGAARRTKRTFKLDGSETEMSAPDGKPLLAKAVWEGKTLVVTIHFPELKRDIRRLTWVIDADGQLVMETEFLGGKPQTPRGEIFERRWRAAANALGLRARGSQPPCSIALRRRRACGARNREPGAPAMLPHRDDRLLRQSFPTRL